MIMVSQDGLLEKDVGESDGLWSQQDEDRMTPFFEQIGAMDILLVGEATCATALWIYRIARRWGLRAR